MVAFSAGVLADFNGLVTELEAVAGGAHNENWDYGLDPEKAAFEPDILEAYKKVLLAAANRGITGKIIKALQVTVFVSRN